MSEMEDFCRTCMSIFPTKPKGNIDNFGIFNQPNLAKKLMHCSRLPVYPSDEYPHSLCAKCYEKIVDFYEFQRMCRDSLRTFKEILMIGKHVGSENDIDTVGQLHTQNTCGISTNVNYVTEAANQCNKTKHCDYILDDSLNDNQLIEFSMDTFMFDNEKFGIDCSSSFSLMEEPLHETNYTRQDSNKTGIVISTTKIKNYVHNNKKSVGPQGPVDILHTPLPSDNVAKCNKSAENAGNVSCDLKMPQRALTNNGHIKNSNYGIKTSEIKKLGSAKTTMTNTKKVSDPTKSIQDNVDEQSIIKSPVDDANNDMDALSENFSDYEEEYLIETTSENEQRLLNVHISSVNNDDIIGDIPQIRLLDINATENEIATSNQIVEGELGMNDNQVLENDVHDPLAVTINISPEECVGNRCGATFSQVSISSPSTKVVNDQLDSLIEGNKQFDDEECGGIDQHDGIDDDEENEYSHNNIVSGVESIASVFQTKKKKQCNLCPRVFHLQQTLDAHKRTHEGLLEYPCPRQNCGRAYRRITDFRNHLKDHDGIPRELYSCVAENCNVKYKTKCQLKRHTQFYHSENPPEHLNVRKPLNLPTTICEICGAALRGKASLDQHLLRHVDKALWPYVCDKVGCSKRFKIRQQLLIHKKRHAGIKDYSCPQCDKKFVTSTNMKNHLNFHTKERSWPCAFCPYISYANGELKQHIRMKHGTPGDVRPYKRKIYSCSFCDRVCSSRAAKLGHERIHTGEKPFACKECGKEFRQSAILKLHMRTHVKDADRNFVCRFCKRSFTSSVVLKHHEMKHTKEKPYKCEECGMSFRWPNNIIRHRQLHVRDKIAENNGVEEDIMNKGQDKPEHDQGNIKELLNIEANVNNEKLDEDQY